MIQADSQFLGLSMFGESTAGRITLKVESPRRLPPKRRSGI